MLPRLLLVFILLPLADLVLIWMMLQANIGLTVLWILISGIAGAWYVRQQGIKVMEEIRLTIQDNKVPTDVLVEGGIVLFAGGLLITPGLLTDIFGFSMLIRPCRRWYRKRFLAWLKKKVKVKVSTFSMHGETNSMDPDIIDADVVGRKSNDPGSNTYHEPVLRKPPNISTRDS